MRLISRSTLVRYAAAHPETSASLNHWIRVVAAARWATMSDVERSFPKASALHGERARFEIAGGNYRLIVAFNFRASIAIVKFIGTHAEYDRIDAKTVSRF